MKTLTPANSNDIQFKRKSNNKVIENGKKEDVG